MKLENSYENGYVEVSDEHRLYYELWGNADKDDTILCVHGGPGGGFREDYGKLFDPENHHVIFYDQRGAGKSEPFGSLENNTTDKLVNDINKILDEFGQEEVNIVGGSWGATLSLTYAIRNPDRVTGMVLRGTFLGDEESIEYYIGGGARTHRPEAWERLSSKVPEGENVNDYYLEKLRNGTEDEKEEFAYELAYYESVISKMEPDFERIEEKLEDNDFFKSLAPLELHYMKNDCFLPDGYILENTHKLSGIPVSIVHGRYDMVCKPKSSYDLHNEIEDSSVHFVMGGHSFTEDAVLEKLKEEIKEMF